MIFQGCGGQSLWRLVQGGGGEIMGWKMEDTDLLDMLETAHREGGITIVIEPRRLDHMDSPIAVDADSSRWLYGLIVAAGLIWWWAGTFYGVAALIAATIIYGTIGRNMVERRLRQRFFDIGIKDIIIWRQLWRLKGITMKHPASGAVCASPDGNWQRFVLDHLAR